MADACRVAGQLRWPVSGSEIGFFTKLPNTKHTVVNGVKHFDYSPCSCGSTYRDPSLDIGSLSCIYTDLHASPAVNKKN